MSEPEIKHEVEKPDEKQVLSIFITKDGKVRVQGTIITDLMAFYGLMEVAKNCVTDMHREANKNKIVKPNGSIINFVRNGK